jgi:RNA polymerase sigma-70 factor (ECF subfamily)
MSDSPPALSDGTASLDGAPIAMTGAAADVTALFSLHYVRMVRVVSRVIRDPGRAEEIAVEAFLKWPTKSSMTEHEAGGWLYRTAVRMAVDELRRQLRRARFERFLGLGVRVPTPEDVQTATDEQYRVRRVLASIRKRDAMLLLLRNEDLSYEDVAALLGMNSAAIGTLLSRAQKAFRNEYRRRYGDR